jgi:HD superfamily phosphodiesterase
VEKLKAEKIAKKFFEEQWNDEKHLIHCQAVIDACVDMINRTNLDKDIFFIAGWIHDIGKLIDKSKHHIESLKFLDKFLKLYPQYENIREEINDCILNHRTEGEPLTIYGEIFKLADKVALHNDKWLEYKKAL